MLDQQKHKSVMTAILQELYTTPSIAALLGFKGGTMAMLFHELDRFSVDLDFDLLDAERAEQVFEVLKNILPKFGIIKDGYHKSHTIFFLISYGERDHNVKVEINTRSFGSSYEIKTYLGIPMQIMCQPDAFAHKLCALYERYGRANRDLFDVNFFWAHRWDINYEIIKDRTGMDYPQFLQTMIEKIETDPPRDLLHGLGQLLNEPQKQRVKAKLVNQTLFQLRLALQLEQERVQRSQN